MSKERARELRWNMTDAERRLWALLRRKKLSGFRFRRQVQVGPYYVDFFCPKVRLIVEVDGAFHGDIDHAPRDEARTHYLKQRGCRVIRFWNPHVFMYPDRVVDEIYSALIDAPPSVTPSARHLPPQGGKGNAALP